MWRSHSTKAQLTASHCRLTSPTGKWSTLSPILWVIRVPSPKVKLSGHEVNHPSSSSDEIKIEWICTSTPPIHLYTSLWPGEGQLHVFTLYWVVLNIEMCTAEWDCHLSARSKRSRQLCSVQYHISVGWHAINRMTASGTTQKYSKERVPLSDGQERQRAYNAILMHVCVPNIITEKQWTIIFYECVCVCACVCVRACVRVCVSVALVSWHAKCMHCNVLSSVACPAIWHFFDVPHKLHELLKIK